MEFIYHDIKKNIHMSNNYVSYINFSAEKDLYNLSPILLGKTLELIFFLAITFSIMKQDC